ncbi:MAG: ABC transporter ATP-binding protein/permease, partial [Lachnospiraceae bacterium]|nr:ABC transporter ATP-binding protein/permease [Lachnospiraceae bacterium]
MNKYSSISLKPYRGKMILYIVLQFLKSGMVLLVPYFYLLFLNDVITEQRFERLWLLLGLYVTVFMAKAMVTVCIRKVYNQIFPVMILEMKKRVLEKYSSLDIPVLQDYTAGELKECLHKDTENAALYFEKRLELWISAINILITTGILLYLNWILAVVSFLLLPISFLITRFIKNRSDMQYERKRQIQGQYNDFMIYNLFFWKEIKADCLAETQQEQFGELWKKMGDASLKSHIFWFLNRTFLAFKDVFLTKMGLYLLGGILVIYGRATVPVLLTFMEYYASFADRLLGMADNVMQRGGQRASLRKVEVILNLQKPDRPYALEDFEQLEFQDIEFAYTEEQGVVLRGIDMKIKRGESVAIMGESGCGKSTLVKIMAGCLIPTKGNILWNGISMEKICREALYAKVGFLMQESSLFNLTIRENLLFGKSDATITEMEDACRRANVLAFIWGLPQGFETVVGENGI